MSSSYLLVVPKVKTNMGLGQLLRVHLLFGICFMLVLNQLKVLLNSAVI